MSGALQSPLTSLLGVSVGTALTRAEVVIPSIFTNWGTTGTDRTINCNSGLMINTETANSYLSFRGTSQNTNGLFGTLTGDMFMRMPASNSLLKFQDSGATDRLIWNSSANVWGFTSGVTTTGNITVGGELVADGGYFNQTNRGLFLGTSYAGIDTFSNSLNIRDGYLAVYDPALYGYGLVINGYSMVKTNGAHDMVCLAVITLGQDVHVYAPKVIL